MPARLIDWCATFRKADLLYRAELVKTRNQEDRTPKLNRRDRAERIMQSSSFGDPHSSVSSNSRNCPHQQIGRHEQPRGAECSIWVTNILSLVESEDHDCGGRKHHGHHHDHPIHKEMCRSQARDHCHFSGVVVQNKEYPCRKREFHQQNQCENALKRWVI